MEADPTAWSNITDENEEDPVKSLLERSMSKELPSRKGKGRPKKNVPPVIESEQPPLPTPPPPAVSPESMIPTEQLVKMFQRSKSQSPPKTRRSSIRFSDEKEPLSSSPPTPDDPERLTLLRMYKQYFKLPLINQHTRKEKVWSDKHLNSEIHQEIKLLENAISDDDPANALSTWWTTGMNVVENVAPIWGLETEGLGKHAGLVGQSPQMKSVMRELLLKYPYLRSMVGFGGYPELKLLVVSVTLIKEVHEQNARSRWMNENMQVPDSLNKSFDQV